MSMFKNFFNKPKIDLSVGGKVYPSDEISGKSVVRLLYKEKYMVDTTMKNIREGFSYGKKLNEVQLDEILYKEEAIAHRLIQKLDICGNLTDDDRSEFSDCIATIMVTTAIKAKQPIPVVGVVE